MNVTAMVINAIGAVGLALTGLLIQSRMDCSTYFKQWLSQFLGAACYCAGYFMASAASYVSLAAFHGWGEPSTNMLGFVAYVLPTTLAFITTLVVDIRHRDFGASITAIFLGCVGGWFAIVAALQFIPAF